MRSSLEPGSYCLMREHQYYQRMQGAFWNGVWVGIALAAIGLCVFAMLR
jgi:hypothetical protein